MQSYIHVVVCILMNNMIDETHEEGDPPHKQDKKNKINAFKLLNGYLPQRCFVFPSLLACFVGGEENKRNTPD